MDVQHPAGPKGRKNHVSGCAFGEYTLDLRNKQRGVRVVEGARLESVYTGNGIEGSNPFPSAKIFFYQLNPLNIAGFFI